MASGTDPANVAYIIVDNGFYYVAYKEKVKVPEIVVSSKGVANGLSEEYNDGWDFGPDSYDPNSTASIPYTQTAGIQEAWSYAAMLGNQTIEISASYNFKYPLQINTDILVPNIPNGKSIRLVGQGRTGGTVLQFNSGCNKGIDYGANYDGNFNGNAQIENITLTANTSTLTSLLNIPSTVAGGYVSLRDVQFSGFGSLHPSYSDAAIYISGVEYVSLIGVSDEQGANNGVTVIGAGMCWITDYRGAGAIVTLQDNSYTFLSIKSGTPITLQNNGYTYITGNFGGNAITCNSTNSIIILSGNIGLANVTPIIISSGATVDILSLRDAVLGASTTDLPFVTNNGTLTYFDKKNVIFGNTNAESIVFPTNSPSLSANPPVSAKVYQNTNPYSIEIDLPVYASTSGTAGYVTIAKGSSSSSLTTIGNQFVNGSTSSTSVDIIRLRVPAGWYYEFTASGVTFGTASVFAD